MNCLNWILLVCVIAVAVGWYFRLSHPKKSVLLIVISFAAITLIVVVQLSWHPEKIETKRRVAQIESGMEKLAYSVGWQLGMEAGRHNPGSEAIVVIRDSDLNRRGSTQAPWLQGVQTAAKETGLKLTVVPLKLDEVIVRYSDPFTGEEIKAETLNRIQREHPNAKVWINWGVPQTSTLATLPYLGTQNVRLYCYTQSFAPYAQPLSWWTAQLQSGRLQAVALDRREFAPDMLMRTDLTDDPEANFKVGFVLLSSKSPSLPPEMIGDLPANLRN